MRKGGVDPESSEIVEKNCKGLLYRVIREDALDPVLLLGEIS